jgi:hypothetical protein
MALYRKNAEQTSDTSVSKGDAKSSGLGRGLESLTGDNTPAEKKPLVVRRGIYPPEAERKRPKQTHPARAPQKTVQPAGVGGRVVIRTDELPMNPTHTVRNPRRGTTVLIRTERADTPKRYKMSEHDQGDPDGIRPGKPIVINPRNRK